MNEATNNRAAEVLHTMNEALQRSGQVVEAELPAIYEQVVAYKVTSNALLLAFFAALTVALAFVCRWSLKWLWRTRNSEQEIVSGCFVIGSALSMVSSSLGVILSAESLIYWSFAPKAAFLEYILNSVK